MGESNVVRFERPDYIEDPLTEKIREGTRELIEKGIEAELAVLMAAYADKTDD